MLLDSPDESLIGKRIAVFSAGHLAGDAICLAVDGVRLQPADLAKAGRIGSVELIGWLQTESHLSKKRVSSKSWPIGRKAPTDCASVHWLVSKPKLELNSSIVGLIRVGMSYADRPEVVARDREYAQRMGKLKCSETLNT